MPEGASRFAAWCVSTMCASRPAASSSDPASAASRSMMCTPTEKFADYLPLKAAPDYHKPVFENEFVLVLDVSIPAGTTVPAHVHPWPAVFITLQPAHLVFRNLAAEVVQVQRTRPAISPASIETSPDGSAARRGAPRSCS